MAILSSPVKIAVEATRRLNSDEAACDQDVAQLLFT
jgi:hypothetical protein